MLNKYFLKAKNNHIFPKYLARRVALFYIFANLFKVWFNRRQLDSDICFCILSVVIPHIMLPPENFTGH